ncbi:MAG: DNA-formamidopyrimidine glycosylase family protein [Verrucomicrobiota bacterium]
MPELAEVEFYKKRWDVGINDTVDSVFVHKNAQVFRRCQAAKVAKILKARKLIASQCHGKQMLFSFSGGVWLAIHLGMTGKLFCVDKEFSYSQGRHDHLVLKQKKRFLIFQDPRCFGAVKVGDDGSIPKWWHNLPSEILSDAFKKPMLHKWAVRHGRLAVKALWLKQDYFPGIGNWMADEILWRAKIHPARKAASLTVEELDLLWRVTREVSRDALRVIGKDWSDPPEHWLFQHRWRDGGRCPIDNTALIRIEVGGRTSCYCPTCQPEHNQLELI